MVYRSASRTRSVTRANGTFLQVTSMAMLVNEVRPLGFEPRTCGLRDRIRTSHEIARVSDVRFRLRFCLTSRSNLTRRSGLTRSVTRAWNTFQFDATRRLGDRL